MNMPDRSRVIHFAEAQAKSPRANALSMFGSVALLMSRSRSLRPQRNRRRTYRTRFTSSCAGEACLFMTANGTRLNRVTSYSWLQGLSINLRTLPRTSLCGVCSTAPHGGDVTALAPRQSRTSKMSHYQKNCGCVHYIRTASTYVMNTLSVNRLPSDNNSYTEKASRRCEKETRLDIRGIQSRQKIDGLVPFLPVSPVSLPPNPSE